IYLHLSDDDGTPGQAADFFNYNISLDQFPSLKALTLFRMEWHSKLDEFFFFWNTKTSSSYISETG
ncbi:unnamed protein product, partial [Rotaria sp. Silwood2]